MRQAIAWRCGVAIWLGSAALQAQTQVSGKVVDETGVAVPGANVVFLLPSGQAAARATADRAGAFQVEFEKAGEYGIRADREAFFQFDGRATFQDGPNHLTITLNHLQEFAESIDVTYSPPAIDPQEPADRKELNTVEVLSVPYPAPQDLRNALPLFQGVVQDNSGRVHVNGGDTNQTNFTLDGFNIADPVTGRYETRLQVESVRVLELQSSRYSADTGRGSAGALDIQTKMGDDKWRFAGTNFIPGFSSESGFHMNKWTPRLEVSGPLARGRAWFHNGFEAFYANDVVSGLPNGQNRTSGLSGSNLTRFQVNLTPSNILTASFLTNQSHTSRSGLSFLDPAETTTNLRQEFYMSTIRDQVYLPHGALVEFGFADSRGLTRQVPQGDLIYQITPFGARGNYFVNRDSHRYRQEGLAHVFLHPLHALGQHQLKFGVDFESERFHQAVERHPYEVLRVDDSVARLVTFAGNRRQARANFGGSQYVLDRWTPRDDLLVEAGLRADWDQIVRDVLWSPRLSAAWAPHWLKDTKIAAGFGVFYDALTLGILAQHQDQVAYSTFYTDNGQIRGGPAPTQFAVDERHLSAPRYRTSSFTVERKLPLGLYGRTGYTHKVGSGGFSYFDSLPLAGIFSGARYWLRNWRHDRYDAFEASVRRTFAGQFEWSAAYTRSSTRTDAVVDYSLENPMFAPQGPGPFPWDAPNRFLTWGWAPLPQRLLPHALAFVTRNTSVAYLAEYRTGYPFAVVNEDDFMVGRPNSLRFPSYFNINLHFERKFRALHYLWAWRFGFNNLLNCGNPNVVNNNIDSPDYLTYGRGQLRAFSVRLRLLGKK